MNPKITACVAAITLAICGGAAAQSGRATGAAPVNMPQFCAQHAGEQERFYPSRAMERAQEGSVLLDCIIAGDEISSCSVVHESNAGWGFGAAALRIACHFTVRAGADGTPQLDSAPRDTTVSTDADNQTHAQTTIRFRLAS